MAKTFKKFYYANDNEIKGKIEKLAELEHEQWMTWAKNLVKDLENIKDANVKARIERWKKDCFKPYSQLTNKMKELDRDWAKKVLEILKVKDGDNEV